MNSLQDWEKAIRLAASRIEPFVTHTPVVQSPWLSDRLGQSVWLKCEQFQPMGAFKIRGAANALIEYCAADRTSKAVTYSTGNHGLAVAHLCRTLGIHGTICISQHVPEHKVKKLRELGVQTVIAGKSQDQAQRVAEDLVRDQHAHLIAPFDDPAVIAGQGTIALELLEQVPDLAQVVVPVSGGGLIAGIAAWVKSQRPHVTIIGVSMERSPVMYESLRLGHPVALPEQDTLADSLQGGIGLDNRYTFSMVQQWVDDVVLVSEAEIVQALVHLALREGLFVEGAAAVAVAWALRAGHKLSGPTAIILTGRNADIAPICRAVNTGIGNILQS